MIEEFEVEKIVRKAVSARTKVLNYKTSEDRIKWYYNQKWEAQADCFGEVQRNNP